MRLKVSASLPVAPARAGAVRIRYAPIHPVHRQARIRHTNSRHPLSRASEEEGGAEGSYRAPCLEPQNLDGGCNKWPEWHKWPEVSS